MTVIKLCLVFFWIVGAFSEICRSGNRNQFKCGDSLDFCIDISKKCDGLFDCSDRSDEINCRNFDNCPKPDWFLCNNKMCIPYIFVCNGRNDCGDFSDEKYCNVTLANKPSVKPKCQNNEWKCQNGICIPKLWVCNDDDDCGDNSDEIHGCKDSTIHCNGFPCSSGECIEKKYHCDNVAHCRDGSDERNCHNTQFDEQCTLNNRRYLCDNNKTCISVNELCDDKRQCYDKSDEGKGCHLTLNCTNCPHECIATPKGPKCVCRSGYRYNEAVNMCTDIDECSVDDNVCDHECQNTNGSYLCSCDKGFYLMFDQKTCKASGDAFMIFAFHHEIRAYYMRGQSYFLIRKNLKKVFGLDADDTYVYWTDLHDDQISIMRSMHNGSNTEAIVTSGLSSPEDLAIDWITGNIYFTDADVHRIATCSANGHFCKELLNDMIGKPRGITVNPKYGQMFWSEWGDKPCICQANMDGQKMHVLVKDNIYWPNGIAIDYPKNRLYWVDAKHRVIESINLDGTKRKIVLKNVPKHPYGIAVFENQLYWSDWDLKSIEVCNKYTGNGRRTIIKDIDNSIFDIHIHYSDLKSSFINPCLKSGCQELCLLNGPDASFTCACSENKLLAPDGRSCLQTIDNNQIIVGSENFLLKIRHKNLGKIAINTLILNVVNHINCMVYDSLNDDMLFVSDDTSIYYVNVSSGLIELLVNTNTNQIVSLDFDYLGNNLYWIDGIRNTIEVLSLNTKSRKNFIHSAINDKAISLALAPEENRMFVAYLRFDFGAHIDCMNMDGSNSVHFIEQGLFGPNITLFYDTFTKRVYWTDSNTGTIESATLDGTARQGVRYLRNPMALASVGNLLFWTSLRSPFLYWGNRNFTHKINLNTSKSAEVLHLATVRQHRAIYSKYPCAYYNGNCSHLCLVGDASHECACQLGYKLEADNHNCKKIINKCSSNNEFKCEMSDLCIPNSSVCDGVRHCHFGEDESNCNSCEKNNMFKCTSGQCIRKEYVCNKLFDCPDKSDEIFCKANGDNIRANNACRQNEFQCLSGMCIPKFWECDSESDCDDESDEHERCNLQKNINVDFVCANGMKISSDSRCNHWDDCGDNSDELNCHSCSGTNQFQCNSTYCVPRSKYCDNFPDCPNGKDEEDCFNCQQNEFKCKNNWCILENWICDQLDDCGDNSDEDTALCTNFTTAVYLFPIRNFDTFSVPCDSGFQCNNGQCIDWKYVCDNTTTCFDNSDEGGLCHVHCYSMGNQCSDICHRSPLGPKCGCNTGYELDVDNKTCKDIDECKRSICAQKCSNLEGFFKCDCFMNFLLRSDNVSCKPVGPPATIIFSHNNQIKEFSFSAQLEKPIYNSNLIEISSLAIDISRHFIYFTSENLNAIARISMQNTSLETIVQITGITHTLDVDYVSHYVYFVEELITDSQISVLDFQSEKRAMILKIEKARKITALRVDPINEIIFYVETEWYSIERSKSEIFKMNLDGTDISLMPQLDLVLIKHLALDQNRKKLYFFENVSKRMQSIDYNGQNRINFNHISITDIKHMQFFDDSLWILDSFGTISKCQIYGPSTKCLIDYHRLNAAVGVQNFLINHSVLQPALKPNMCGNNSLLGRNCSHLCMNYQNNVRCVCENGRIETNERKCSVEEPKRESVLQFQYKSNNIITGNNTSKTLFKNFGIFIVMLFLSICFVSVFYLRFVRDHKSNNSTINQFGMRFYNPQFGRSVHRPQISLCPGQHEYVNPCDNNPNKLPSDNNTCSVTLPLMLNQEHVVF